MAVIIPDAPPVFGGGALAERALFEALRDDLPDDYYVVHSLRYVTGERAREGEIDFLILHRERGILVLECKGYGVRANHRGEWVRRTDDGDRPLDEAPLEQAQRHVRDLVGELRPRVAEAWPELRGSFPFVFGHAVAFPTAQLKDVNLPLDHPRQLVLDASDLAHVRERIEGLFSFWAGAAQGRRPVLEPQQFKRFRNHILLPKLDLAVTLGKQLDAGRRVFVRLCDEQKTVIAGLLANRRLRVLGGAGTGKTVLALEAARLHACAGRDVLLACFNKALARRLEDAVGEMDLPRGRVDVFHFHKLCADATRALGRTFAPPSSDDRATAAAFWNESAPLALLEAIEAHKIPRYDALVVDEGQDFPADWWGVLNECLRDRQGSYRVVFYDPAQEIFGRGCSVPEEGTVFELGRNLRNTRAICEYLRALGATTAEPHPDAPRGEPPEIAGQPDKPAQAVEAVAALLRRLTGKEGVSVDAIVLLTPHKRPHSFLVDRTELAGIPLADNPADRAGKLLHVTIGAFKGLESDVVILADADASDPRSNRNAVYVAAGRAVQRLFVFEKKCCAQN